MTTNVQRGFVEVTPCHRPGVIVTLRHSGGSDLDELLMGQLQAMFAELKVQGYVVDDRNISVEVVR